MKISAKVRYGIAAMISLARNYTAAECTTLMSLSEKHNISKIYLEQIFSSLKRAGLVISTKGSQGGYKLSKTPEKITARDIFLALETSFAEKASDTVSQSDSSIESAINKLIFDRLDETIDKFLSSVTLDDLLAEADKYLTTEGYMYYL